MEIDGSYGEGGGQIVRTAVALAAVTGTSIRVSKIRQGRPKPGLAFQHAQAILALAGICSAKTAGILPGSSDITFEPGRIKVEAIALTSAQRVASLSWCSVCCQP